MLMVPPGIFVLNVFVNSQKTRGFYNRTHSTKDHKDKPSSLPSSPGSLASDTSDMALKASAVSASPSGNLSLVKEEENDDNDDEDGSVDPQDMLEYTSAWCTSIANIYMDTTTHVPDTPMTNFVLATSIPLISYSTEVSTDESSSLLPLEETVFPDCVE